MNNQAKNIAESQQNNDYTPALTDVMTGNKDQSRFLYYQLKMSMLKAKQIDIIVSFLMITGVEMVLDLLEKAIERGVKVRILTGSYLGITQPEALYMIRSRLGDRVEMKFYKESHRSFHPKSYIFHYDDYQEVFIGSSNLSKSALTSGVEWNYRLNSKRDEKNCRLFYETFEELFNHQSIELNDETLKAYSKKWRKPAVAKDLDRYEEVHEQEAKGKVQELFRPRGAQIEALYSLKQLRNDGVDKGLVCAATGVGKTYLAAFDSQEYERVLFVAHREEILKQAARSFVNVRKSEDYGFFNGNQKDTDKAVIFASVSSLGKEKYLNEKFFEKKYFDYLIIDEFHHAVTDNYKRIMEYFEPKFMLGLTATPDRMDGKGIRGLCDYNVPFELSLKDAINKGMLVPFHYYGIYDETVDYDEIQMTGGEYSKTGLEKAYATNTRRFDLIFKHYNKYVSKRAFGFCCSRKHAEEMAKAFNEKGIKSVAVYSDANGEYSEDRNVALEKLRKGEVQVIFSVDMFNEGVDVAELDMVMFLRPTESPVVFLQQLGRGLRTHRGKYFLNVLDFIGNYKKAENLPFWLANCQTKYTEWKNPTKPEMPDVEYPDDCIVDFDLKIIEDIFTRLNKRKDSIKEIIYEEFCSIREELGRVPTRTEIFQLMSDNVYQLMIESGGKDNICLHYFEFLENENLLSESEQALLKIDIAKKFLENIESTKMQKSYKMPLLLTFYNRGNIRLKVSKENLLEAWNCFFEKDMNWRDLDGIKSLEQFRALSDNNKIANIRKNPWKAFLNSGKGMFYEDEDGMYCLYSELEEVVENECFKKHFEDIISYRTLNHYQSRYQNEKNTYYRNLYQEKFVKHLENK